MAPGSSRQGRGKDATIARSLARDCHTEVRSAINKYLDDHPGVAPVVLRMMERGLFEHQEDTDEGEILQKSQNKVELLPLYRLQNLLSHLHKHHHEEDKTIEAVVHKLLTLGKKSLLRVVVFICEVDPKCAVPSRKSTMLFQRFSERYVDAGKMLTELTWDDSAGDVDWPENGVFRLVPPEGSAPAKIMHGKSKKQILFPSSRAWQSKWYVKDNHSPSTAVLALHGGTSDDEVVLYKLFARGNTPVDGYLLAKTIGEGATQSPAKRQRVGGLMKKAIDLQLNLPPVPETWGGADSGDEETQPK